MKNNKKIIKLVLVSTTMLVVLFIYIFIKAEIHKIKIGSNFCGVGSMDLTLKENIDNGHYIPFDCAWCLGKLSIYNINEHKKAVLYHCIGIKFETDYE